MLGNFINLISVYLGSKLTQIARAEIENFNNEIKKCIVSSREPIFLAQLGFNQKEKFSMVPSKDYFISEIINSISNIGKSIVNSSKIVDFEGKIRDIEKYGHNLIEY
jgi:hypothetical protein